MSVPVELAFGVALVAWGFADYLFPQTVLRFQSALLDVPPEPKESLARYKRLVGLLCILAGLLAVVLAFD